jgi:hypothetical protein
MRIVPRVDVLAHELAVGQAVVKCVASRRYAISGMFEGAGA